MNRASRTVIDFLMPGGVGDIGAGSDIVPRGAGYNFSSPQSSVGGAASGGFLLYPNKANNNMIQSVYSK